MAAPVIVSPPRGVCNIIDNALGDFSLATCQDKFCSSGVDAYIDFVNQMVALIQRYAVPLAIGMGLLVLCLIVWACNVRTVGKRARQNQVPTITAAKAITTSKPTAGTTQYNV